MGNIPENSWPAVYHAASIVFSGLRTLFAHWAECGALFLCVSGSAPPIGGRKHGQRIDFSDFYGAGKVSA
jgi:hypothetical protein